MAQIYLPTGAKLKFEYRTQEEFEFQCEEHRKRFGNPLFEMRWPNKKIFRAYRDGSDNQIEIVFNPIRITDIGG
jgi:hypothetical protein